MDSPLSKCLPVSVPYHNFFNLTRIVQTPTLTVMLYESANVPPRTIFTDGRDLPKDPNPTWFGYSVGRWEGDTLVITSPGSTTRVGSTVPDIRKLNRSADRRLRRATTATWTTRSRLRIRRSSHARSRSSVNGHCHRTRSCSKTSARTSAAASACPAIPESECARIKWHRSPASTRWHRGASSP
jgi:hypothetical protein